MLVASVMLARFLGARRYGEFGLLQTTLGFFSLLVGPSLGMAVTKYAAELRETDPERLGRILELITAVTYGISSIVALGMVGTAGYLASGLLKAPELAEGLRVAALALLMMAVNGVQVGVLTGFEAFKAVALVNSIRGLVTVPALWLGGARYGALGALWGLTATWAVACAVSAYLVRWVARFHGVPLRAPGFWRERPLLLQFSLPGWLAGILAGAANWTGSVFLARQPHGLEQTGIFSAANQFFLLLMFVPQIIANVSLPITSERVGAGDRRGALAVVKRVLSANMLVTIPAVIPLAAASPFIMSQLGTSYARDWPVLIVTLATVPPYAAALVGAYGIVASGRMWAFAGLHALYLLVFVGVARYLAEGGALGLGYARLTAYLVYGVGVLLQVRSLMVARTGTLARVAPE